LRWLATGAGLKFAGYAELWQWSVDDLEAFWQGDLGTTFDCTAPQHLMSVFWPIGAMPGCQMVSRCTLNYGRACLRATSGPNADALMYLSERTPLSRMSWEELGGEGGVFSQPSYASWVSSPVTASVAYMPNSPAGTINPRCWRPPA